MDVNVSSAITSTTEYTKAVSNDKNTQEKADVRKEENVNSEAAVFEKSKENTTTGTYKINKMSAQERKTLVDQLKADADKRQQSLIDLAKDMITKQGAAFGIANDDNSVWKFLASGKFSVDAQTKAKAQEDISEDGYWGVKQTSKRLFDFASALAGDDEKTMRKMQKAIEKGYKQAEKTWGGELPEISKKTLDATNKLFDEYYKSKQDVTETKE